MTAVAQDAADGVEAAVPIPTKLPWPASPITRPDDVRRVVAHDDLPVLRNLFITQGYHDISQRILARTGGGDMNWCTLGCWASRTAGAFVRNEEIPSGGVQASFAALYGRVFDNPKAPSAIPCRTIARIFSSSAVVGSRRAWPSTAPRTVPWPIGMTIPPAMMTRPM